MYCPMVVVFSSLRGMVPSDDFIVIECNSGIDVKIRKLIGIGKCRFKGFLWYF